MNPNDKTLGLRTRPLKIFKVPFFPLDPKNKEIYNFADSNSPNVGS